MMKKSMSGVLCMFLVAMLFAVSVVSAATVSIFPQSGSFDNSSTSIYYLTASDLSNIASSNDVRYANQATWSNTFTDSEALQFNFNNSLNINFSNVSLLIEYQFSNYNSNNLVQLSYYTSSGWTAWQNITMPTGANSDINAIVNPTISLLSDLNNFKIRVRARDNGALRLEFDLVTLQMNNDTVPAPVACTDYTYSSFGACNESNVSVRTVLGYTPEGCTGTPSAPANLTQSCVYVYPEPACIQNWSVGVWSECIQGTQTRNVTDLNSCNNATGMPSSVQECTVVDLPTCSVDYLKVRGGTTIFNLLANPYVNATGTYYVYGSASANEGCYLDWIGYNRTSPNLFYESWRNADNQGSWLTWRTQYFDDSFVEGNHQVCCAVESRSCAGSACDVFSNTNCTDFCIDTQAPGLVLSPNANGEDCADEEGMLYSNSADISWTWDAPNMNGCAPLNYYEVELHYSNSSLIETVNNGNSTTFSYSGLNGKDYYILVRAVDMAGNIGGWSSASDEIVVDTEAPIVEITSPLDASWTKDSFNVVENDSDNIGFNYCQINVNNTGWQSTVCGQENTYLVDVDSICALGNVCLNVPIAKQVQDKACNSARDAITINIDRQPPVTNKTVGLPKYPGFQLWGWLVDWFIKDNTQLSFAVDDGNGIWNVTTYYTITNASGSVVASGTETPVTMDLADGIYNVTYYSVDGLGNTELLQSEIDKIDTEAPVTTKNYVGLQLMGWRNLEVFNNLLVWMRFIHDDTNITLGAIDSEVGNNITYYQILVPSEGESMEYEWYGNTTQYWYQSLQECIDAGNAENKCFQTGWDYDWNYMESENCAAGEGNPYVQLEGNWCTYTGPITIEQYSEHKICYFSIDHLGNTEEVECQVFSVDNIGPTTFIINPDPSYAEGNLRTACVMPLDVAISDEKVGVSNITGEVYAVLYNLTEDVVWRGNLTKALVLNTGEERWIYPNSVDLTGLAAGNYYLYVYAKDKFGNDNKVSTQTITLDAGIFVPANWIKGCNVGINGGICNIQFTACVRGVSDMSFDMSKLMDSDEESAIELASPLDLNATLVTNGGQGYVGYNGYGGYEGQIVSLNANMTCGQVINNRVKFNVTMNFSQELIQNIGSGTYHFDWDVNPYVTPCEIQDLN
jgi:archaellum component FlaG (FlaF/FlaG flagellin family)